MLQTAVGKFVYVKMGLGLARTVTVMVSMSIKGSSYELTVVCMS